MDFATVITAIGSVGYPIIASVCCGWFVKYVLDRNATEIKELRNEHSDEMSKVTEALNNNTLVIQKLVDKMSE